MAKKKEKKEVLLKRVEVANFKSILRDTIELGRLNVFIGENGSGKSNILEALALAGAAFTGRLDLEDLDSRGMRVARTSMTFSSFLNASQSPAIDLKCFFGESVKAEASIRSNTSSDDVYPKWVDANQSHEEKGPTRSIDERVNEVVVRLDHLIGEFEKLKRRRPGTPKVLAKTKELMEVRRRVFREASREVGATTLGAFCIYNLNIPALRGMQKLSKKSPLGIYGEDLDVLVESFKAAPDGKDWSELAEHAKLVNWLAEIVPDPTDSLRLKGFRLGRSTSKLYFRDRFMAVDNNVFSAENANEGILHILFYLALFISDKTPEIFGIDNIETALNPQLCRGLIRELSVLAKKHGKQALITTHNPAILDGLDSNDDEQRLFVVHRDDDGHTVTRRVRLKPQPANEKFKLSELWTRGHLGGLPRNF